MDALELATFDDTPPYAPDPAVWTANLEALRAEQPELARELEQAELPPHWRPVESLDGFPTYRVELPGEAAEWLARTAAPATRAAALLAQQQPSSGNRALPAVATGAELSLLLDRLSVQQAVYVFEADVQRLAAVLRTVDVAQAITAGRCVLIPPGDEQVLLERLLARYPGLLPPATIVAPQLSEPARLEHVRKTCASAARQADAIRSRRFAALDPSVVAGISEMAPATRLAVLALGPGPTSHRLADQLAAAAGELGWSTCSRVASGPRDVHVLPHYEALAGFGAELVVCIAHAPGSLPLPPHRPVCQWHLRTRDVPDSVPADDTIHLAATPRVANALRTAGVPDRRLVDFHWACAPRSSDHVAQPQATDYRQASPASVVIVGDLPDASAAACGIEQPTHRQLWKQLHQTVLKAWETPNIRQPAALLRNAERTSRITLGERSLHERMVRIIEHVLIPAVVLETILQTLRDEPHELLTVGRGWDRCASETVQPLAESLDPPPPRAADAPVLAAVFAGPLDPLTPDLFHAAELGWPLLIHSPDSKPLTAQLGGIFRPQQHYRPFAGRKELRTALGALRSDAEPARRCCERVREHLRTHHTYGQRLIALAERLGLEQRANES